MRTPSPSSSGSPAAALGDGRSAPSTGVRGGLRLAGFALVLYVFATAATDAVFIADAPDYARDAAAAESTGHVRGLMEFGHPLWRPLGYAFAREAGTAGAVPSRPAPWLQVLAFFTGVALAMGGIAAAAAAGWLRSLFEAGAAAFGVLWLLGAKAFLNYSQVGSPYVPGLGFLLAGLFVSMLELDATGARTARDLSAGLLFGLSALCWTPFGLVLPGAVFAPLLLRTDRKGWLSRVLVTGLAGVGSLAVAYVVVGLRLGFAESESLWTWASRASGGRSFGGLGRLLIGLPRSFVDLGELGRLAKRYLLADPLCPTRLRDLLGLDLLKLLAVAAGPLAALAAVSRTAAGRRFALAAAAMAAPLLAFALLWQGGDLERYLPATPALLLLMAAGFQEARGRRGPRGVMLASLAVMLTANAAVLSRPAVRRRQEAALTRLPASPGGPGSRSVFVVPHPQDGLFRFHRDYPFHPRNRAGFAVHDVFAPGMVSSSEWRSRVDRRIAEEWEAGGSVYVSSRLLAERPEPAWDWIEGDDRRVTWRELREHFAQLEYEPVERPGSEFLRLRRPRVPVASGALPRATFPVPAPIQGSKSARRPPA